MGVLTEQALHANTPEVTALISKTTWGVVAVGIALAGCGPFVVVQGPESCELATETNTDFDGVARGNLFYYDNGFRAVGLTRTNAETYLVVLWASPGLVSSEIPAGTEIEVALADGSRISVTTDKPSPRVAGANRRGAFSQWATRAPLKAEQLAQLANSLATAMRTNDATALGQKVLADPQARLQTLAICLANHSK